MTYDGERADARALDLLESILRDVAEELTGWRTRATKAERAGGGGGGGAGGGSASGGKLVTDLESENRVLRQRVEAARSRVHEIVQRLTFLEEQARESLRGNGGGREASGGPGGPAR